MRIFIVLFCILILQIEANDHTTISEKMIVSSSENEAEANENLLKLKVYYIEHPVTRALEEKEVLNIGLEKLGNFYTVVIKPINSLAIRLTMIIVISRLIAIYESYMQKSSKAQFGK